MINNLSIIAFSLCMIIKNYTHQAQAITMPNNKPVTTHQLLIYPGHPHQYFSSYYIVSGKVVVAHKFQT